MAEQEGKVQVTINKIKIEAGHYKVTVTELPFMVYRVHKLHGSIASGKRTSRQGRWICEWHNWATDESGALTVFKPTLGCFMLEIEKDAVRRIEDQFADQSKPAQAETSAPASEESMNNLKAQLLDTIRKSPEPVDRDKLIDQYGNMVTTAAGLLMVDGLIRYVYSGVNGVAYEVGNPEDGNAPIYGWGDILKSLENSKVGTDTPPAPEQEPIDNTSTEAQELGVSEEVLDAAMDGDVQLIQQWWKAAQETEALEAENARLQAEIEELKS